MFFRCTLPLSEKCSVISSQNCSFPNKNCGFKNCRGINSK